MTSDNLQYYGIRDVWFRLLGVPLIGFLIPLLFFDRTFGTKDYYINACFALAFTTIYWQVGRYFFIQGNKRFPDWQDNSRRLRWILGRSILFIIAFCSFDHWVLFGFCVEKFNLNFHQAPHISKTLPMSLILFTGVAGMYESMRNFSLWKITKVEKEQLEKENLVSQLEGLKNQVNPHFLFNSLNTLVHIIPEHPETAVRFVQKLSKVYRYVLEIRETKTTPLSSELDFLNAYIFLLKERFGENIQVNIHDLVKNHKNTEGVEERHIIPLSLQILLENAIKHNVISTQKPLTIDIFIEGEKLIVKNNLQRKNQIQEGTGVGLENIKTRYHLVSKKDIDVIVTTSAFMVALPLLKAENQLVS